MKKSPPRRRLTITLDARIVAAVRAFAKRRHTTPSRLIEAVLKELLSLGR